MKNWIKAALFSTLIYTLGTVFLLILIHNPFLFLVLIGVGGGMIFYFLIDTIKRELDWKDKDK
jgi:hypothetical protein